MKILKKFFKSLGIFACILLVFLILGIVFLTIREYRPEEITSFSVTGEGTSPAKGTSISILTYNTGYGALSAEEDFFMDGGKKVQPKSKKLVEENLSGIAEILLQEKSDVYFLQEVDQNSKRSYGINQRAYYEDLLQMPSIFGQNFKCDYVPYPFPPIGKVDSGILTMTDFSMSSASRISLPASFSWPVSTCNLKRCMLETRIPVENSDSELVLINFHLEAYDNGEGKIAQTKMLAEKLSKEYEAGNYVIAGGDFNQTFEILEEKYPVVDQENWIPGKLSADSLPPHFSFAVDDTYPTCRLLNKPYTGDYQTSQVYVIDGFIVSDNIQVEKTQVIHTDFQYTDHQPVKLQVILK